jgi:apolipoprotein N-acyltransferase
MIKENNPKIQKDRWSYLWLLIGTGLGFFWTMPIVWWLSPVFMLRFTRSQRPRTGFLLVWLSTALSAGYVLYDILNALMPSSLVVYIITTAVTALIMGGLPYLVDRLFWPRLKGFSATLVLPLIMTSLDYISAKANPLGSIGAQGYMQYGNLVLMQLLSITGMWGIVFLVNWFGPVINWVLEQGFEWKKIRRGTLVYVGIMLLVLGYGSMRLAYGPMNSSTVRIHGITEVDMRGEMLPKLHEARAQSWESYRELSKELQDLYLNGTLREAEAGAQIVHWPEMAVNLPIEDEGDFMARAQKLASDEGIYIVMGLDVNYQDGSPWENKLVIIDPDGEVVLEHHKYALVSMEGTKGGDGILRTVDTPYGTLSGIVCNDTNHEEVVTQAGRNGTDLLFAPSLEYRAIDPIHAQMASFRAVENGITLVRQADNGLSIVVDPYGRMLAQTDHWTASDRVMVAQVPVSSAFSLYSYIGDAFAWLCMLGFVVLWGYVIVQRRQEKQGDQG